MNRFARSVCLLIVVVLVLCLGKYAFFPPKCVHEVSVATYGEFVEQVGETTVPRSARDLYFVWCSVGLGGRAHAYRFTAPLEDLKAYALSEYRFYVPTTSAQDPSFVPLTERPSRPDLSAYGVPELPWFDVEDIEEGIALERDHADGPFVWIDTRREILYSWWTD